jgi:surface antigen
MMKSTLLAAALLLAAAPAFAQDRDRDSHQREEHFARGDRLPPEYRQDRFEFNAWRERGLSEPPRGYRWMQIGGQFVLVERRDGVILEVAEVGRRDRDRRDFAGDRDDREARWERRYSRTYTVNDDRAYTECRNQPDPAGVLAGALLGGLLGNAAGGRRDSGGATVAGVVAGGAIGAALTSNMKCEDRSYAYDTYTRGFNGGRADATYEWRNPRNGDRGEMHVLDYYNDEDDFRCAVFSHTIYIDGRPQEARGRACQQPNGTWAIID